MSTSNAARKQALRKAIDDDNPELVRELAAGLNLDAPDRMGLPPLFRAVLHGRMAIVELLISIGANVNVRVPRKSKPVDFCGYTPLHVAYGTAVTLLLDHGAELEASCPDGITPFRSAATHGSDTCRVLLERGARPSPSEMTMALCQAIVFSGPVRYLASHPLADVNARYEGLTPLLIAVKQNNVEAVRALLENGADAFLRTQSEIRIRFPYSAPTAKDVADLVVPSGATPMDVARALRTKRVDRTPQCKPEIVAMLAASHT